LAKTKKSDDREYPDLPISCVGAVVRKDGKILLVRRGQEPGKGMWSIPGGAIELGETIYEAAAREVLEECNVEIKIKRVLDAVENIVKDGSGRIRFHYVIIDLQAEYASGRLKAGTDAAECGWFTPEAAAKMNLTPTLRAMFRRQGMIKDVS
jgi:8-oxo-dGTP diphosphatase